MIYEFETFFIDYLNLEDASSLSSLMIRNGKRFQEYLPKTLAANLTESASKEYISRKSKEILDKTEFTFAIKDQDSKEIAGLIILKNINWITKQGEFAYCLGSAYSGKGWMTRSIKAIKDFAQNHLELNCLHIIIHKTNTHSIHVAERAGFSWTTTLEKEFTSGKSVLDMELYENCSS